MIALNVDGLKHGLKPYKFCWMENILNRNHEKTKWITNHNERIQGISTICFQPAQVKNKQPKPQNVLEETRIY